MRDFQRIPNTHYFAAWTGDADEEPWIFSPLKKNSPHFFGWNRRGIIWFISPRHGIQIYDANTRSLAVEFETPLAIDRNGKPKYDYRYSALQSADGSQAYLLVNHARNTVLYVLDLDALTFSICCDGLPANGMTEDNVRLLPDGRLVFYGLNFDAASADRYGLVTVSPATGEYEYHPCSGSSATGKLICSSPDGRYWLRSDNSTISHADYSKGVASLLRFNRRYEPDQFFSFCIEVWEFEPLRLVARVAPMWMNGYELPDNGRLDGGKCWHEGRRPERMSVYARLAAHLRENSGETWDMLTLEKPEWLWPDKEKFYNVVTSNLWDFQFRETDFVGWQPDGQAFWIERHGFLACIGVDGTQSPKMLFERFGMRRGTWLPAAAYFRKAVPQPGRKLLVEFPEGLVVADGWPQPATVEVRKIATTADQFQSLPEPDAQTERLKSLAEKVRLQEKRASIFKVPLASLEADDCIAAIDALTEMIGPDFMGRAYDNQLKAEFVTGRKRMNEKRFFAHIRDNNIDAAPALTRLLEAVLAHTEHLDGAYYDPYAETYDLAIGLFGHAAQCLAKIDPGSTELLMRYGALIDTDHESFFVHDVFPLVVANAPTTMEKLALCEERIARGLGNAADIGPFWRWMKMGEFAQAEYAPADYAAHLVKLARHSFYPHPDSPYGYYELDTLARHLLEEPSPWEAELCDALRQQVPSEETA